MKKFFLLFFLLIVNCFLISSLAVAQNYRQDIFKQFNDAVNIIARGHPLNNPMVKKAMECLIVEGKTDEARKLLKQAGWPNGFSIDRACSEAAFLSLEYSSACATRDIPSRI